MKWKVSRWLISGEKRSLIVDQLGGLLRSHERPVNVERADLLYVPIGPNIQIMD